MIWKILAKMEANINNIFSSFIQSMEEEKNKLEIKLSKI